MDLINRYLQAVKFWLPKNQKQDIIAELAEDLRSQIEDREAELGRQLNESEVAELLKQRGRPVLVANRYRPQQHLIGPVLFPIYLFVLEVVAGFYLLPWVLVWITVAIFRPVHPGQSLIATIGSFWTSFWPMAFFMVGSITTVFAILERVQDKSKFMEQWDPRKLPPVRDPNRIPLSTSVTELTVNIVFCSWWLWWAGGHWYPTLIHLAGVTVTLAPVWRYFFWGYFLLGVVNTVASAVNVFRPHWTLERAVFRHLVRWRRFRDLLADEGQHCSGDQCRERRSGKNRCGRTRDQLVGGKIISLGGRCLRAHRPEQRLSDHPRTV